MFQKLWRRLFARTPSVPQQGEQAQLPAVEQADADTVVLYARLGAGTDSIEPPPRESSLDVRRERPRCGGNHRRRILGRSIDRLGLCAASRRRQLEAVGIETAEDLLQADLDTLVQQLDASGPTRAVLGKYRRAIRLAAAVPGLMPREAMLLIQIHRRSVSALASESPGLLYRDMQRFAWSSRGQRQLRGRPLPSQPRVRAWVEAAARRNARAARRRRSAAPGARRSAALR